jgi:hypothetical protein
MCTKTKELEAGNLTQIYVEGDSPEFACVVPISYQHRTYQQALQLCDKALEYFPKAVDKAKVDVLENALRTQETNNTDMHFVLLWTGFLPEGAGLHGLERNSQGNSCLRICELLSLVMLILFSEPLTSYSTFLTNIHTEKYNFLVYFSTNDIITQSMKEDPKPAIKKGPFSEMPQSSPFKLNSMTLCLLLLPTPTLRAGSSKTAAGGRGKVGGQAHVQRQQEKERQAQGMCARIAEFPLSVVHPSKCSCSTRMWDEFYALYSVS